jgi:hypothetical protein
MTWNIGFPPKDVLVALVVRKWVCATGDTCISFIVNDPIGHMTLLNPSLQFEPSQTVIYGRLVDEEGHFYVLDEDGNKTGIDRNAILAWAPVPSFAIDRAAATQTEMLLHRARQKV